MKTYKKWADRNYSVKARVFALIPAGLIFLFLLPYLLIVTIPLLDAVFHFPLLRFGFVNFILGALLILIGAFYAYGSISQQLFQADGTPLPMMATKKLLVGGVFNQCRNPMTFGTLCVYIGIAVIVGSISSMLIVLLFGALLLTYIKTLEEHELEMRFGEEYKVYKKNTPFLFPRIFTKRK